MFDERVEQSGPSTALRFWTADGRKSMSWAQWHQEVDRFANALQALGVERGDRVLLLAKNRPEWVVADLAIMRIGAIVVPIHTSTLPKHCEWLARDAEARWAIVEDPAQLQKFTNGVHAASTLEAFVLFDDTLPLGSESEEDSVPRTLDELAHSLSSDHRRRVLTYDACMKQGEQTEGSLNRREVVAPQDLATIVYTSGTTGTPRGVCLTHGNLTAEAHGNAHALPLHPEDRQLLVLPLSQVFARAIYLTSILVGCEMSFSRGMSYLRDEFRAESPTFFVGVPSIFESLAAQYFTERVGHRVFNPERVRALARVARKRAHAMQGRGTLSLVDKAFYAVGDRTVFRQIRQALGGRLRFAISGGAPVSTFLTETFQGMGIPIYEGYGLTETSGAIAVNTPEAWRIGSVGRPLKGVEVRIAEDGEVLIRGPFVSPGYWRDEKGTQSACDDGWLRTGDLGAMVDGYLMITDRRCQMITLRDGKSVSPQRIETRLQSSPVVKRAVVTRNEDDQLVALLTLAPKVLRAWADARKIEEPDDAQLSMRDEVYDELSTHIDRVNAGLRASEQIAGFAIIPRSFSIHTGELTTTNRIRRPFVLEKYGRVIRGIRPRNVS